MKSRSEREGRHTDVVDADSADSGGTLDWPPSGRYDPLRLFAAGMEREHGLTAYRELAARRQTGCVII